MSLKRFVGLVTFVTAFIATYYGLNWFSTDPSVAAVITHCVSGSR